MKLTYATLATFIALALTGCATRSQYEMEQVADVQYSTIFWVKQIPEDCMGWKGKLLGCADRKDDTCIITMPEYADDFIIAHEFKHCFGFQHKRRGGE